MAALRRLTPLRSSIKATSAPRALSTSSAPRSTSSSPPLTQHHAQRRNSLPEASFLSHKVRNDLLALHAEDPARWTATSLATRFRVSSNVVAAALRLAELRLMREKRLREEGSWDAFCAARDRAVTAWTDLSVPHAGSSTSRRFTVASPSDRIPIPQPAATAAEEATESSNAEKVEDDAVSADAAASTPEPEIPCSAWAAFIEDNYKSVHDDWTRKATFAFIEVGKEKDVRRAVWLREGATGKIRIADKDERELLLSQVKAKDSSAFRNIYKRVY